MEARDPVTTMRRPWWRSLVRPAAVVVVSVAVGWIIVGFVGAIDWGPWRRPSAG